jgi:hypothetical protein
MTGFFRRGHTKCRASNSDFLIEINENKINSHITNIIYKNHMLFLIKLIHTVIWVVMAAAAFYILYAGVTGTFDWILLISIMLLIVETIVLIVNKWTCPLTPMAEKYTSDREDNFDIYLPEWLAKYNKMIFGTVFVVGLILVVVNWINLQ